MGYELCIKREEEHNIISTEEWIKYVECDSEFERIESFSANLDNDEIFTVATPNAGLWKVNDDHIPFTFYEKFGEITVKNPDQRIIVKMSLIAKSLNAVVVGEEGEKYDDESLKDLFRNPFEDQDSSFKKRWWQFWR